jgi:cyclase
MKLKKFRLIARLDIKNENVVKGIQLEGQRVVGDPKELSEKYYNEGIDEIFFIDSVASLYERGYIFKIIEEACKKIFVPICMGGGLRTLKDVEKAFRSGADKVFLNTGAFKKPGIIKKLIKIYGSQCIVGSVEAKKIDKEWIAFINNGREPTNLKAEEWAIKLEEAGVGEIFLTSVDKDGTKKGLDLELIKKIRKLIKVPLIVSGGTNEIKDINDAIKLKTNGIGIGSALHYKKLCIKDIKNKLLIL